MVRDGEADAFFSAGNTGATVAVCSGWDASRDAAGPRSPLATFPFAVLLLDAGATVSCRPQDLLNFAILGGVLAKRYFGLEGKRASDSSMSARSRKATTSQRGVPSHGRV